MARRKKAAIAADKKRKALHPGKRISESGNVYYENRPNRSDVDRRKKFMAGGSTDDSPKIYVADLAAYNEGKLIGEWLDLSNYDSGSEVMDAIQELLEKWSEEQGVEREEYAIHDTEFIPSNLYSEYMGEDTFDKIIEIRKVAEDVGVPTEVITQWMSDTGHDDPTSASDAYYGRYTDEEDFAYQMVDDLGIESFIDFERYLYVSDTDKRLLAQDMSSSYASDIRDEDGGERLIEEANLDLDEYQEADSDRQEEMLDEAEEIVSDNLYNEWLDGLDDPYHYLVEVQGLYSPSDFKNASFVQIDYEALAEALGYDYNFVNYDGEVYVFSSNFKRGGNVKTAVNRKKSRYKKAIKKYATGGNVGTIDTSLKLKILTALRGYNNGLTIQGVLENMGLSNYRFNKYASEKEYNSVEKSLENLISKGLVEESGLGFKITQKGSEWQKENYSKFTQGGNVGTIDADIAKLQAVVDSDMIPQEVKTKAKAKIAQLETQKAELSKPAKKAKVDKKAPAKKVAAKKESSKKPVVSKKETTKKAAPKKAAKKTTPPNTKHQTPNTKKPKNSEKGRIMVLAKELHKEGKTTWAQSLKKAGEMLRESKGKPVVIKPTRIQKGTSDAKADKARVAAKPGKRISKSGRIYYENRKNRSDI
jgi:antirestriction protein